MIEEVADRIEALAGKHGGPFSADVRRHCAAVRRGSPLSYQEGALRMAAIAAARGGCLDLAVQLIVDGTPSDTAADLADILDLPSAPSQAPRPRRVTP